MHIVTGIQYRRIDGRRTNSAKANLPSLHWQASMVAPDKTPIKRRVLTGQMLQLVWPGDAW